MTLAHPDASAQTSAAAANEALFIRAPFFE
jgi:hypothetical protein